MNKIFNWLKLRSSALDVPFIVTMTRRGELEELDDSLDATTAEASQVFRANHGGGMPCPDVVCSKPNLFDNF
jgi:hypothetical protein